MVIRKARPAGPRFQYYVLIQELSRRGISTRKFALAIGETNNVVSGAKGEFPLEKMDLCLELVNNWTGPRTAQRRISKPSECQPVTREMLLVE